MSWVEAIKKYSEITGAKFAIPKRESPEYAKIKAIQEKMGKGEAVEKMPRAKKMKKQEVVVNPVVSQSEKKSVVVEHIPEKNPIEPMEETEKVVNPVITVSKSEKIVVPVIEKKLKPKKVVKENPVIKKQKSESVTAPSVGVKPKEKKVAPVVNKVTITEIPKVITAEKLPEPVRLTAKEAQVERQKAKQVRLEEQAKKAGQASLQQTRMVMKSGPVLVDFA